MLDPSVHFPTETHEYGGLLPPNTKVNSSSPVLEWYGSAWDGGENQLVLGFEWMGLDDEPDAQKTWDLLSQTANAMGFTLVPNPERNPSEPRTFFFDLDGNGQFEPQEFINRFTAKFYQN